MDAFLEKKRHYGWFRCSTCKAAWESAHVYYENYTTRKFSAQECKKCKIAVAPYRAEPITCRQCGNIECTCTDRDKRHVDPKKPHRSDLCTRCQRGLYCSGRD